MCGRYTRRYTWKQVHAFLDLKFPDVEEMAPSYNVAPSQAAPVCRAEGGKRGLAPMQWGLIPAWSKDGKPGPINARCETAATNGLFRNAYHQRRCLVPADGFYEWKKAGNAKQPYFIHLLNDRIFCFAGLWERWQDAGRAVESFTILTTRPNELVATIHDRMPVILRKEAFDVWLGADPAPADLFEPFPAEEMTCHPVSTRVNSPRNNDASLCSAEQPETLF